MGNSVTLDPYDMYVLQQGLGKKLPELLGEEKLELSVQNGVILPNMKMTGQEERCAFLDRDGRCSIHPCRPGVCRLFPLGRIYENGDFKYFLQTKECQATDRSKVKVSKWIDTPNQARNHVFLCQWHGLISRLEDALICMEDLEEAKRLNMTLLQTFYLEEYETSRDFYEQFGERLAQWEKN